MDRDVNLLFGVFAVQLRKVTPSQIMEAAGAWASDPSRALSDRLIENQALTEDDRQFIQGMVEYAVKEHGGDAAATLVTLGGSAQVERSFYGSVMINPNGGVETVLADPSDSDRNSLGVEESPGRYSQVGETARGGMGRILLVHDEFLGRDVALKELLPGLTRGGEGTPANISPARQGMSLLTRFLQEARITGQLEHPSIVPVYELGHRSDGTLYYTMKLVRGDTLEDAIATARDLKARLGLLNHFIDLCQGIAYAHSLNVIHRDIKPSNVMVGKFGETVILDWGLAKVKDKEDVHSEEIKETLRMMNLGEEEDVAKTAYGEIMGTPLYMPPEQAKGQLDQVDERSDVYSLGAVLYELLTGRPPFEPAPPKLILEKVIGEKPGPVRELVAEIPAELAAICEKALAKDPKKRYASARALADEVQRFQSGALVQAHEYTGVQLVKRFVSRHKPLVASSVLAAIAIFVISAVAWLRITQSQIAVIQEKIVAQKRSVESYQFAVRLANNQLQEGNFGAVAPTLFETPPELRGWEWGYLMAQSAKGAGGRDDTITYIGDVSSPIEAAQLSADGIHLFVPGPDQQTVHVWNIETGEVTELSHHFSSPLVAAIENDTGTRVVTIDAKENVIVWNMEDLTPLYEYERQDLPVSGELSPDGRTLVAREERAILIYTLGPAIELNRISVDAERFSVDVWFAEPAMYYVRTEGKTDIFYLDSHERVSSIPIVPSSLERSNSGSYLASTTWENKKVEIWDLQEEKRVAKLTGATRSNPDVLWLDEDRRLAVLTRDQFLLFDTEAWDVISSFHPSQVGLTRFEWKATSLSDRLGVSDDNLGIARTFDLDTSTWSTPLELPSYDPEQSQEILGWGINLDRIAVFRNGRVEIHRLPTNDVGADNTVIVDSRPSTSINRTPDIAFNSDLTRASMTSGAPSVVAFTIDSKGETASSGRPVQEATAVVALPQQEAWVVSDASGISIIDDTTDEVRGRIDHEFSTLPTLAISPTGRTLAAASGSSVDAWSLDDVNMNWISSFRLPGELGEAGDRYGWALAVTEDIIAIGGFAGGEICVIDIQQRSTVILRRHVEPVVSLSLVDNRTFRQLVSGSLDNTAIYWLVDSDDGAPTLLQHTGDVVGVQLTDRGRLLTLSRDSEGVGGILSTWNLGAGIRIAEFALEIQPIGLGISADETSLAIGGWSLATNQTKIQYLDAIPWWPEAWETDVSRLRLIQWARTLPEEEIYLSTTERGRDEIASRLSLLFGLRADSHVEPPTWMEELDEAGLRVLDDQRLAENVSLEQGDIIVRIQSVYSPSLSEAQTVLLADLELLGDPGRRISIETVSETSHKHFILGSRAISSSIISANDAGAAGAMRTISTAQVAYQAAAISDNDEDGIGDYGTLAQLGDPDGSGTAPGFIDSVLATGVKAGFRFTATVVFGSNNSPPRYRAVAEPIEFGVTGSRSYYVDETGVIRFTADGTVAGPDSPPLS